MAAIDAEAAELLALHDALEQLAQRSPRMASVVECRFFGGLSVAETAEVLDASVRTVERDWTRARAYLQRALEHSAGQNPSQPDSGTADVEGG
jgi:RNA polymerase sigma factor (sigma-70 family)